MYVLLLAMLTRMAGQGRPKYLQTGCQRMCGWCVLAQVSMMPGCTNTGRIISRSDLQVVTLQGSIAWRCSGRSRRRQASRTSTLLQMSTAWWCAQPGDRSTLFYTPCSAVAQTIRRFVRSCVTRTETLLAEPGGLRRTGRWGAGPRSC